MKKTYKSSLLALSVLASFTSCSESESLQQANLSKDKITFHATLDNSWKPLSPASSSRAAIAAATEKGPIVVSTPFGKPLYLHSVVQETADLQQAAAITRGAMQDGTNLDNTYYNNSFGVTAISTNNGTNTALFINQKASKNNEDIWEIEDKTNSRWPFDALVSFHAYAPFNNTTDGMWSVTTDAENVKTKIKYTAKSGETEIPAQPDIIVATNAESRSVSSDDKAVDLKFSHALTAVNFAISQDLTEIFHTGATDGSKLKSIKLSGIPNEGTCELTAKEGAPQIPSQTWTFDTEADGTTKKTGSYTFNLVNKNITIGESYALTSNDDKNILMMIPQKLNGTKAQLTFVLDIKGKGDQTFTFDLSNQTWLPGTSVTYKLSASAVNHLENAEVKFPDSWKDTEQAKYSYPKTDFNEGESIGLYVVNSNDEIEEANLKLTRDQDGKWMPENNNTKFLKLKNYKYFAYYPYNATAPTVDATKDKADEFFKDMITNWNPVKEQKTEDVLLSQDLQVAEGVIDGDASTLTFNMEHSMGLAVLNLKSKEIPEKRIFLNNDKYTYYYPDIEGRYPTKPKKGDYTDYPNKIAVQASTNFTDNIPYNSSSETEKKYLQIVKANQDVVFKAADQEETNRTAWGFSEPSKSTFNVAKNSCMTKDIESEAEFYYFSHYWKYTGKVETFTAPEKCDYKLECWGAQGGGIINQGKVTPAKGGGYSYGTLKNVGKGKQLFVCVGGQGTAGVRNLKNASGGYNGGGKGGYGVKNAKGQILLSGGGGGGATHIALSAGLLTQFVDKYQTQLLIVAGGAAGYSNVPNNNTNINAAYGGGVNGGPGMNTVTNATYTVAGQKPTRERFGKGQDGRNGITGTNNGGEGNSGGGGGFCGGYSDQRTGSNTNGIGGGGSGYVNTSLLVNATTIAGNQQIQKPNGVVETGHLSYGEAVITWLGKNPSTTK